MGSLKIKILKNTNKIKRILIFSQAPADFAVTFGKLRQQFADEFPLSHTLSNQSLQLNAHQHPSHRESEQNPLAYCGCIASRKNSCL
jgi:hypothetical protein